MMTRRKPLIREEANNPTGSISDVSIQAIQTTPTIQPIQTVQPIQPQIQQQTKYIDKPIEQLIRTTIITREQDVPDGTVVRVVKIREVLSTNLVDSQGNPVTRVMIQYEFQHESGRVYLFSVFYSKAFLSIIGEQLKGKINRLIDLVGKTVKLKRIAIIVGNRRIERLIPIEVIS